jgi:Mrp family chromosome partitioning ATPase
MIVDGLVRAYDVVIVDCAPLARSGDPHALARIADQCLYVVRWNATDRDSVLAGLRRLAISGMRNGGVGMVLTRAQRAALV